MAKQHRHGVQVGDVVVLKGEPDQMRKLRCPNCQGMARAQKDKSGKDICVCTTCGRTFTSKRL